MASNQPISRVVEKHYSPRELSFLIGFDEKFWRQRAKDGEFTLTIETGTESVVVCAPLEISGELRIPATAMNAWLARHPYRYDAGVKARNQGELRRKLAARAPPG